MPLLVLLVALFVISGLSGLAWRATARLVLAAGLLCTLVGALLGSDGAAGFGVVAILFAGLLAILGRRRDNGRRRAPVPVAKASALVADAALWRAFRRELGWSGGRRLANCRERFDRFLLIADAAPFSPETEELAILVRRHVPGLVAQCLADCRTASPGERRARLGDTMAMLDDVAARAEQRRAELWAEGSAFDVYRARFAAGSDPG